MQRSVWRGLGGCLPTPAGKECGHPRDPRPRGRATHPLHPQARAGAGWGTGKGSTEKGVKWGGQCPCPPAGAVWDRAELSHRGCAGDASPRRDGASWTPPGRVPSPAAVFSPRTELQVPRGPGVTLSMVGATQQCPGLRESRRYWERAGRARGGAARSTSSGSNLLWDPQAGGEGPIPAVPWGRPCFGGRRWQRRWQCPEQLRAAAAMWHAPVWPQTGEPGRVGAAIAPTCPNLPPPKSGASERGARGSRGSCPTSEHTRLTKQRLITGKSFWLESGNHAAPQKLPRWLLSGVGPCGIDARGAASMGTGAESPAAQQKRHTAPARVLCRRARPAPRRQRCQHPRAPPAAPCPPAWAALALPYGTGPSCSSGAAPGYVPPGMHRLGQGESGGTDPNRGVEAGDGPQLGGGGEQTAGGHVPHPAPAAEQPRRPPAAPYPAPRRGDRGWETLSPGPQCIRWKGGRKGRGRGVYTFENCQPCRVMGDPNRITRQTCILPSILK